MKIYRLPALSDNYIFLLHDPTQNVAAVVDPAIASPVLKQLEALGANLIAIFNTHHHQDHIGGNPELMQSFPNLTVYGGAKDRGRIPGQKIFLEDGDRITFADKTADILFVPGHTRAHIAYYFPPADGEEAGNLFCGDTLFAGGCGRLFEGSPAQMVTSLSKFRCLPDNTRVWCAHEYTLKNLQFALSVEPQNLELQERLRHVRSARDRAEATVPSTLDLEKRTNPFLRSSEPTLQAAVNSNDPIETFARLRKMKDQF